MEKTVSDFRKKSETEISDKVYDIDSSEYGKAKVTKNQVKNSLRIICPTNISVFEKDFIDHFEEIRGLIPFCSSPKSFRTAWDLRSELMNPYDAMSIFNEGGQLLPNNKDSRVFQCIQQGVELGKNKRLIMAVRHSEGNYEDKMDDLGVFTYQPPNNTTGMLRYRWSQFLSFSLRIPYILIVVLWFKMFQPINEKITHAFMIAPAKKIDYEEDIRNMDISLSNPLKLQIINQKEALSVLNLIFSLKETDLQLETRFELSDYMSREWSYDKLNNTEKGRKIKRWAQQNGKRCPGYNSKDGTIHNIEFRDLPLSKIAFGHIIPQNWAKAFTFMLDDIDHPDNLYLTCKNCNSSLSDSFPDKSLRDRIVRFGTIGDWLRKHEDEIRKASS